MPSERAERESGKRERQRDHSKAHSQRLVHVYTHTLTSSASVPGCKSRSMTTPNSFFDTGSYLHPPQRTPSVPETLQYPEDPALYTHNTLYDLYTHTTYRNLYSANTLHSLLTTCCIPRVLLQIKSPPLFCPLSLPLFKRTHNTHSLSHTKARYRLSVGMATYFFCATSTRAGLARFVKLGS